MPAGKHASAAAAYEQRRHQPIAVHAALTGSNSRCSVLGALSLQSRLASSWGAGSWELRYEQSPTSPHVVPEGLGGAEEAALDATLPHLLAGVGLGAPCGGRRQGEKQQVGMQARAEPSPLTAPPSRQAARTALSTDSQRRPHTAGMQLLTAYCSHLSARRTLLCSAP